VFKHYPVHDAAIPLAEAAIEAQVQRKFWKLHDRLFQDMRSANRQNVELWAQELGMDVAQLKAALDSGKHRKVLEADQALGRELGVNATPTLFVNGRMLEGAQPLEVLQSRVEEERARAQKLLDAGVSPERLYEELTKAGLPPEAQPQDASGGTGSP
jgi:protein-disulfide isomerase